MSSGFALPSSETAALTLTCDSKTTIGNLRQQILGQLNSKRAANSLPPLSLDDFFLVSQSVSNAAEIVELTDDLVVASLFSSSSKEIALNLHMRVPLQPGKEISMEGELNKRPRNKKAWNKRFFKLSHRKFGYWESKKDENKAPRYEWAVETISEVRLDVSSNTVFYVRVPDREIELQAGSSEMAVEWVRVLKYSSHPTITENKGAAPAPAPAVAAPAPAPTPDVAPVAQPAAPVLERQKSAKELEWIQRVQMSHADQERSEEERRIQKQRDLDTAARNLRARSVVVAKEIVPQGSNYKFAGVIIRRQ